MAFSLGFGTTTAFVTEEFRGLFLNDQRLDERARRILKTFQQKLGSCIHRLFLDPREARQAYDFFSNPKISSDKCHCQLKVPT